MRKQGFYERYIKRPQDFLCALLALFFLSPVLLVTAVLVRIKLGSPVIFKQKRPGKDEKIFTLYKFRTMTDKKDKDGNLLPDEVRLTSFGKKLRATSLDELPELFNILKGDMAVVGPRPLLVRDMVFMTTKQRKRHSVRPGLTGLAQVNGRNAIDWEKKLAYDQIIWKTIQKALLSQEGITEEGMATAEDYGDYLLRLEKIGRQEYEYKQRKAQKYQQGE